jgi:hypothetical protein
MVKRMVRAAGLEIRRLPREESAIEVIYSAFDEQVIIERYIEQLACKQRFCVDIGASDGISCSNTYALFRAGWAGLAVECDGEKFTALAGRLRASSGAQLSNCRVTPENVESLLRAHGVPREFGFLSLDIDGYDYFVLERILEAYRPSLICAEINEKIPPPIKFTVKWESRYRWATDHFYGQSIAQLATLAMRYDYALARLDINNAFLIPHEICPVPALSPEAAYRTGYAERPDRKQKVPWNADMETLLTMPPQQGIEFLRKFFAKYEGKYICEL